MANPASIIEMEMGQRLLQQTPKHFDVAVQKHV
jgi:hypothetical protein